MSRTARVTAPWTKSYDPALAVARDQRVQVHKEDDEWPGWFWCVDKTGLGGWLPRQCLDATEGEARVVEDFDTTELTVEPGDVLILLHEREGWAWCRNEEEVEGWVPERVLGPE